MMLAAGVGSLAAVPLSAALIDRPRLGTPAALALIACGIPLGFIAGVPVSTWPWVSWPPGESAWR